MAYCRLEQALGGRGRRSSSSSVSTASSERSGTDPRGVVGHDFATNNPPPTARLSCGESIGQPEKFGQAPETIRLVSIFGY